MGTPPDRYQSTIYSSQMISQMTGMGWQHASNPQPFLPTLMQGLMYAPSTPLGLQAAQQLGPAALGALISPQTPILGALTQGAMNRAAMMGAVSSIAFPGGGGPMGQGFGAPERQAIYQQAKQQQILPQATMGELAQMVGAGVSGGAFQAVRSVQEFKTKFDELLRAVKTVTSTLGTSLTESMQLLQTMRGSGFFGQAGANMLRQVQGAAYATGMTPQGMLMSAQGMVPGQMQQGIRGQEALAAGILTQRQLATSYNMGILSNEDVFNQTGLAPEAGGMQAMGAARTARTAQRLRHTARGGWLTAAMLDPETGGVDPGQMERLRSGSMSLGELQGQASRRAGQYGQLDWTVNRNQLASNMMVAEPQAEMLMYRNLLEQRGITDMTSSRGRMALSKLSGMGLDETESYSKELQNLDRIRVEEAVGMIRAGIQEQASVNRQKVGGVDFMKGFTEKIRAWTNKLEEKGEEVQKTVEELMIERLGGEVDAANAWLSKPIAELMRGPGGFVGGMRRLEAHSASRGFTAMDRPVGGGGTGGGLSPKIQLGGYMPGLSEEQVRALNLQARALEAADRPEPSALRDMSLVDREKYSAVAAAGYKVWERVTAALYETPREFNAETATAFRDVVKWREFAQEHPLLQRSAQREEEAAFARALPAIGSTTWDMSGPQVERLRTSAMYGGRVDPALWQGGATFDVEGREYTLGQEAFREIIAEETDIATGPKGTTADRMGRIQQRGARAALKASMSTEDFEKLAAMGTLPTGTTMLDYGEWGKLRGRGKAVADMTSAEKQLVGLFMPGEGQAGWGLNKIRGFLKSLDDDTGRELQQMTRSGGKLESMTVKSLTDEVTRLAQPGDTNRDKFIRVLEAQGLSEDTITDLADNSAISDDLNKEGGKSATGLTSALAAVVGAGPGASTVGQIYSQELLGGLFGADPAMLERIRERVGDDSAAAPLLKLLGEIQERGEGTSYGDIERISDAIYGDPKEAANLLGTLGRVGFGGVEVLRHGARSSQALFRPGGRSAGGREARLRSSYENLFGAGSAQGMSVENIGRELNLADVGGDFQQWVKTGEGLNQDTVRKDMQNVAAGLALSAQATEKKAKEAEGDLPKKIGEATAEAMRKLTWQITLTGATVTPAAEGTAEPAAAGELTTVKPK